jgi:predicted nucleic acid-binding protein
VDTGAFVAKEIAGDQFHATARGSWNEVEKRGYRLVSSEHVLDESVTLIARRSHYAFAAQWGNGLPGLARPHGVTAWFQIVAPSIPGHIS